MLILDISQQRTNGFSVLFFKLAYFFSTGIVKGTALNQKYASQNIKYANQNTKYADQNTRCPFPIEKDTKYADQNTKVFMLFCREASFVVNLRTFLAYNFQMRWRTKNDKYQVWGWILGSSRIIIFLLNEKLSLFLLV